MAHSSIFSIMFLCDPAGCCQQASLIPLHIYLMIQRFIPNNYRPGCFEVCCIVMIPRAPVTLIRMKAHLFDVQQSYRDKSVREQELRLFPQKSTRKTAGWPMCSEVNCMSRFNLNQKEVSQETRYCAAVQDEAASDFSGTIKRTNCH
ncbi:hypothetical protein PAMP_020229 [Pampus punctatissimus]